jgi:polyprenyl-phospho-N-acetylgalactosaminyl synthase
MNIQPQDIFVIIRVYNEASVLQATLNGVLPFGYSIVVVDDGSQDGSADLARALPVHVLSHVINLGAGAALSTGIQYALRCGARLLVSFDADGQHLPQDIVRLLEPLQKDEADIVLGSRFLSTSEGIPRTRQLLLRAAVLYTSLTTGLRFTDAHNGLRAMSAATAAKINLTQNRMAYASEIYSEIRRLRLRYVEVPVSVRYTEYSRGKGQRNVGAVDIVLDLLEGRLK